MHIAVSGKFSDDHFERGFAASGVIRNIIERASLDDIETALSGLVFFPVIISDAFGVERKSHRSYSRKERAEFVNVEIDVGEWASASPRDQLALMLEALKEAVRATHRAKIYDTAKNEIISRVQNAFEATAS